MGSKSELKSCCVCKNEFDISLMYRQGRSKYYCENCVEPSYRDWCILFEYVKKLYNVKQISPMIITQLNKYKKDKDYSFTDIGMYYTLKYYYEMLQNEVNEEKGVGIIPYYYGKASKFYGRVFDLEEIADTFDFASVKKKVSTKYLNSRKTLNNSNKQISLELWKDEENSNEESE